MRKNSSTKKVPRQMDDSKSIQGECAELFEDIRNIIQEKMRQEFDASTSTTPGLWQRLEAEYDLIFARLNAFEQRLGPE